MSKIFKSTGLNSKAGYVFIAPTFLGFILFIIGPMIAAIIFSLFSWDLLSAQEMKFIGIENFRRLFCDPRFFKVYGNTIFFVLGEVSLSLVFGLLIALVMNHYRNPFFKYGFRIGFFFPFLTCASIVGGIWAFLYSKDVGAINHYLGCLGIPRVPWLSDPFWAKVSIIIFDVWKNVGFYALIFLAGLTAIPHHLYEAAKIDGANFRQCFRNITLPMLTPTIFFLVIIGVINTMQLFDAPFILTRGEPGDSTRTIVMYIYEHGFKYYDMGFACAAALTLFLVMAAFTFLQFRLQNKWVHYS